MEQKQNIVTSADRLPELGTSEAAIKGCVNLIASRCGESEEVVHYWLDLYFQVRLAACVNADRRRRDAELIKRIPQVFGTPAEKGQDAEEECPAPESLGKEDTTAQDAPPIKQTSTLTGFEPVTRSKQGAPRGNTNGSDAAKFKRETLARLMRMRGDGLTIDGIVSASNGTLTDGVVLNILQARKMSISHYRLLAAVLDKIES